mgnify:CR=1 FL=1
MPLSPISVRVESTLGGPVSLPTQATTGSAGYDLCASASGEIAPGAFCAVPTGLKLQIPEGFEAQVRPRSGLAAKQGVTVLNAPGTIDSDYRGEVKVILVNHGREPFRYEPGMRIAQLIFSRVQTASFELVAAVSDTHRGEGGFGSTGK